ncbi:unnamed protein product [Urochloa humidicola]
MKRKKGDIAATDLRIFLERTAVKRKQSEMGNVNPSNNENQMHPLPY